MRGKGIGAAMFRFAVERGKEAGARLAQLDVQQCARTDAHRFYARMGFEQSHAGFKMKLR